MKAGQRIPLAAEQVKALEAQRDAAQKRVAAGIAPKIDLLLRTEVALSATRAR